MRSGPSGTHPETHQEGDIKSDVAERLRFEAPVIDPAAGLVNLKSERVDQAIEDCLRRIVEALGLDRSTLAQRSGDDLVVTHSWAVPGQVPFPKVFARADLPWMFAQLTAGASVVFSRPDDLPAEAAIEKATARRVGPRSNVTMPLTAGGEIIGALAFGSMRTERTWPPTVLGRLGSVSHMVAGVLERRDADRQLRVRDQELCAALAENEALRARLEHENRYLREQARSTADAPQLVAQGPAIQQVLSLIERVAPTDAPVLLLGETGVGKELVAEEIHARSARAHRTLVKVNCAALAPTLIEGELFGREKGAYTGALNRQIGRFELAHGSTLFLDEVSEFPFDLQAKLLRVLQDGTFERLGSPHSVRADVRIIAATNRDLEQAVADGHFRADLYFRLAVFPVVVPPLRERPEDIPLLVRALVDEVGRKMGKRIDGIDESSLTALQRYAWPGNVRELRNIVERAIILSGEGTLRIEPPQPRAKAAVSLMLEDVERSHILRVLEQARWRIRGPGGAAEVLGLLPTTLEARMTKLGIRRAS